MENLKTMTVSDEIGSVRHTSLGLAATISGASFLFAFVQTWVHHYGVQTLSKITTAFDHPGALGELIAEAIGASLLFPTIHVGIASLFTRMRNPSSRRRIFIGWGIFTIALGIWTLWTKNQGY